MLVIRGTMIRFLASVSLLAVDVPAAVAQGSSEAPRSVALRNVTVVDVRAGQARPNQTVLIVGNRIAAVGGNASVPVPGNAVIVDASGKYIIPGLWDMHVHLVDPDTPGGPDLTLPLLVANGVTGIRDLGSSDLDSIVRLRAEVRSGMRLGPRMLISGKILDGAPMVFPPDSWLVWTPDEARRAVDSLAGLGVDAIKAYEMLQREAFLATVARARDHALPLAAHVPLVIDASEASEAGVRSFEHLRNVELACSSRADSLRLARTTVLRAEAEKSDTNRLVFGWSLGYGSGAQVRGQIHSDQRPRARATFDQGRCEALMRALTANRTFQVATLIVNVISSLRIDTMTTVRASLRYVPVATRDLWERETRSAIAAGDTSMDTHGGRGRANIEAQGAWYFTLVRMMRDQGVELLAGTDVSNPYIVPGFSLHEELGFLVRAGLSPLEALRTATVGPARYMAATDSLGSIEPGKIADLVLLDADPLEAIGNARRIHAVVLNGRYLDRRELDALLAQAAAAASGGRN